MSHRERGEPLRRETVTHVSGIKRHLSHRNRHAVIGAPEEIRTPDPLVRSQVLYPTELRARREDEPSNPRIGRWTWHCTAPERARILPQSFRPLGSRASFAQLKPRGATWLRGSPWHLTP